MRTIHLQCHAGICGDMMLGALVDAGADFDALVGALRKLPVEGWEIRRQPDVRGGISGTRIDVDCEESGEHGHRHFSEIREMLARADLAPSAKQRALAVFQKLAEAEGQVHNTPPEQVHFHEVGAVDSILDITGCAIALDLLDVDRVTASTVELGGGTVRCAHGLMPVPAPATALLVAGMPVSSGAVLKECTTPTGAALLAALADAFNPSLSGEITATGAGIGQRDTPELPNVLHALLYEEAETTAHTGVPSEILSELSATIDDMTGEELAYLLDHLLSKGALDVWMTPATMKKSRPGTVVTALVTRSDHDQLLREFFRHSTTLGIRSTPVTRYTLDRESQTVETPHGPIRVKQTTDPEFPLQRKPEFEDCAEAARKADISVREVARSVPPASRR